MRRLTIFSLAAALMLALLSACQQVEPPNLTGTGWLLSSLDGALPLPSTSVTLEFGTDGTVSGSDGCNSFSTTYTQRGSDLTIEQPMAATMMACPEPVMDQAATYTQALADTDSFELDDNLLTLRRGRRALATFVASSQALDGTTWQVVAYNNGRDAVVSVIIGSEITAEFTGGEIAGNASCNSYFSAYTVDGETIAFGPIGQTTALCSSPPGVMQQEQEFLTALASAVTYRVEGDRLEMRTAGGSTAVNLRRERSVVVPDPGPGVPTGRVTATGGANLRSGPGTNYPVLGVAPFGAEGEIVGRSADAQWWAVSLPAAPGGIGWASASLVAAVNAENVPILQPVAPPYVPPPPATPVSTPTPVPPPTATPVPQISFGANPTRIDEGQCATLNWSVQNVRAVWVYPQGEPYDRYPQVGEGTQQVCPTTTTTYEMRVVLRNGATELREVTIVVNAQERERLAGTSWIATGYFDGQAMVSALSGTTLTANFDNGGQISGQAGCNTYNGSYNENGNSISIGPLNTGRQSCAEPTGVMEQEATYLNALASATTFRIDGNMLELRDSSGTMMASFNRQ